jgi:hypothetical protein
VGDVVAILAAFIRVHRKGSITMRRYNRSEKKLKVAACALASAGLAGWMGTPAAQGSFIISDTSSVSGSDTIYEFFATNAGGGTGTTLEVMNITVALQSNHLVIDNAADIDGDTKVDADVTGAPDETNHTTQPAFGAVTGSFMGLVASSSSTTNADTSAETINTVNANGSAADYLSSAGTVSSLFTNGTVSTLQMKVTATGSLNGGLGPVATSAIPFANIVVPTGTGFKLSGTMTGNSGTAYTLTATTVTGSVGSGNTSTVSLSLTNTADAGTTAISGSPGTISGSNGNYIPENFPVTGAAQTAGSLSLTGFNPPGDTEIYGLAVSGETSLSTLETDLAAAGGSNITYVGALTGSAGALLSAISGGADNVEIIGTVSSSPSVISYNFGSYTSNGTVTVADVSVIPEPTGLGLLALGSTGLIGRRRRKTGAILS